MIRHEAIAELSRDHHQALVQAMALKRATDENAAEVAANFVRFFDEEAQHHFEIEEQVLLPLYAKFVGLEVSTDRLVVQVLHEHLELRALVETLRATAPDVDPVLVRELGQRLDGHVRHEERKLFPQIQAALSEQQLAELAVAVLAAEAAS